jgi:ribosome-binding factor A
VRRPRRYRPERVAARVQECLAEAIASVLKDPRIGFTTITSVTVSRDCTHATVRVSVMGDDDEKARAMEGLSSARGFLRSHLAHKLTLRTTPDLHFSLDRGLEHAARINRILEGLSEGDES